MMYAEAGDNIYSAIRKVQSSLLSGEDYQDLSFNDISIRVAKNSNINDLTTIYNLKHQILRLKAGYKD
jgi:hypothetical protein